MMAPFSIVEQTHKHTQLNRKIIFIIITGCYVCDGEFFHHHHHHSKFMKHTHSYFFFIFCSSLLISCLPAFFIISPFQFHLYFNGLLYMMMMELSIFSFCSVFFSHCKTDFISFLSALITGLLDKKDTIKMMIIIISMMMIMMCNSFDSFHSRNFFFFRAISCHSMNE